MPDTFPPTSEQRIQPDGAMAEDAVGTRIELGPQSLREHTARGTIINGSFTVGLYTLGLLRGFVVAGLLTTRDYGVWGVVIVTFGTLLWLKQLGVGDKYIQQSEADQRLAFQRAFTLELLVTGAFVVLMIGLVPVVALVYGHQELIAPGLVIISALGAWGLQAPLWVFYRRMDFVRQRKLQAVEPIVGFVVTVGLAAAGVGYWSLVVGFAAGAWAGALVALARSPYPLALRFDRRVLGDYFSYSWPLFIAAVSSLVIAQSSIIAGQAVLGLTGVGIIVLASSIANYVNRVDEVVTATLYPAICAVRDRVDLLFESFVKSNRLALMWGIPFGVGLALFASDLVQFGIGERWRAGVGVIEAFGIIAGISHIGFNWDAFYRARGDTRPIAIWSFVCMLAFLASALPLLIVDGLDGFAIGMTVMAVVSLAVRLFFLARLFPGLQIVKHMARALGPTVPAAATVALLRAVEAPHRTLALALGELAVYVVVTVAATLVFERTLLREVAGYLRPSRAAKEARSLVSSSA